MRLPALFPHLAGFRLRQIDDAKPSLTFVACSTRRAARCPSCDRRSMRVHSQYERRLFDLPFGDCPVRLRLRVRPFRCLNRACRRQIFAERFPRLAPAYARRTNVQRAALVDLGLEAGGAAGARLAKSRGLVGSRATIVRLMHASPIPELETPRALGVDDWARKRGQTYGTILVDLENRRVVDLLGDRTADALATWLRDHPGVEVIARDRGGAYADGARQGAPEAVQVADRFHLLANVGDALEGVLARHHHALRAAAAVAVDRGVTRPQSIDEAPTPVVTHNGAAKRRPTKKQLLQGERRHRREACYDEVVRLFQGGMGLCAIARHVGLSRQIVRRCLRTDSFAGYPARATRPSILAPYEAYLSERWMAGCHNATTLWDEIRAQGFPGAASLVRVFVATWRTKPGRPGRPPQGGAATGEVIRLPLPTPRVRSPRQARWLLLRPSDDLTADERAYREALLGDCSEIAAARNLADTFGRLIRERDQVALDPWLRDAAASGIPEFREFVRGVNRDKAAVETALILEWSNGQTEGHINRLKFLKRQMYGRASFQLLRRRVLKAA